MSDSAALLETSTPLPQLDDYRRASGHWLSRPRFRRTTPRSWSSTTTPTYERTCGSDLADISHPRGPRRRSGLEAARAQLPDFVVADVMMPEIDGSALGRALKGDAMTRCDSGHPFSPRARHRGSCRGPRQELIYLIKPLDPAVLEATVANLSAQRRRLRDTSPPLVTAGDPGSRPCCRTAVAIGGELRAVFGASPTRSSGRSRRRGHGDQLSAAYRAMRGPWRRPPPDSFEAWCRVRSRSCCDDEEGVSTWWRIRSGSSR